MNTQAKNPFGCHYFLKLHNLTSILLCKTCPSREDRLRDRSLLFCLHLSVRFDTMLVFSLSHYRFDVVREVLRECLPTTRKEQP